MTTEPRIPILLDTDIGSDIDDALCLAYLLRQPRCELVGITTVTGEARERAMLADAVCRAAGRTDIPIHSGAEKPFFVPQGQPEAPQREALANFPHRTDFPPNTAVEFLRQTIRARPGEITLLTIGPLTNIGLLFALDPEIPALLKGIVLMCGVFHPKHARWGWSEWNAMGDPHATALVYGAPVASHISLGLDVTLQCAMSAADCRQRMHSGPLEVAAAMAEVWFRHADQITFHDPLAAAVIFHPELCTYQDGRVEIELASRHAPGITYFYPSAEAGPHRIATTVNAPAFYAEYFSVAG